MKKVVSIVAFSLCLLFIDSPTSDGGCGGRGGLFQGRPKIIRRVIGRIIHPFKVAEGREGNSAGSCANGSCATSMNGNCADGSCANGQCETPQSAESLPVPEKKSVPAQNYEDGQPSIAFFKNLYTQKTGLLVSTDLPEMVFDSTRSAWVRK